MSVMKLISCYIENFGCLKEKQIHFNNDLTSFCLENGKGKSTLCAFISAVLYGMKGVSSAGKAFLPRQKYLPYSGGGFGGNLILEKDGRQYRIEAFFDEKSVTKDTLRIYDHSGNQLNDIKESPGVFFTGLDKESFEKTLFFSSEDPLYLKDEGFLSSNINSKLNTPILDVSDLDDCEPALEILEKTAKKLHSARGNKGAIPDLENKIRDKEDEISKLHLAADELEKLYEKRERLSWELSELHRKSQKITSDMESNSIYENAVKDFKEFQNAHPFGIISRQNLNILRDINNRAVLPISAPKTTLPKFPFILGGILLCAGVATALLSLLSGILLVIAGVGAFVWGGLLYKKDKAASLDKERYLEEANKILNLYNIEINDIAFLEKIILSGEKTLILYEDKKNRLEGLRPTSPSPPGENIFSKISEKSLQLDDTKSKISQFEKELGFLSAIEGELDDLKSQKTNYENKLKYINTAMKAIKESEQSLRQRHLTPIKESFEYYAKEISPLGWEGLFINDDLQISFERKGVLRNDKHLSSGELCLCRLLLRLALIRNMFHGEKVFIILDDPFLYLDEKHLEKTILVLKKLSLDIQILYFTCHKSRDITL